MADNVPITAGSGTSIATDDVGSVHYQRVKLDIGGDGATSPVVAGNGLPVTGTFWQATQPVSAASLPLPTGASTETTLAAQSAKFPASLGVKTAANSFSVTTASDDALTGGVTETAPASDTASSGLNGRLQRIAQRVTSLIALLPSSLGVKTASGSLSVTTASDDALTGIVTETAPASDTASSGLNGRLQRIAQRLTSLIAQVPATLGVKASTASMSVVTASDDALTGIVTETAPASDTASSGLNGRLQRIAQRLTSLIALLPTSLGIKTASASLSVAPASDAVYVVAQLPAATTGASGTITTGGTAQNAAASNAARKGFWLQNNSTGDLWVSTIATAVQSQPSLKLSPGVYYESPQGGAGTGAISIIGATTGQAYSGREW